MGCSSQEETTQSALRTPKFEVQFTDVSSTAGIQFKHAHGGTGKKVLIETMGPGAAFWDYDNDGDQDLFVVNSGILQGFQFERNPQNVLYRNNGDGTFTDITETTGLGETGYGMGVAVADYDNDGYLDLFLANFGTNHLYHNNGDGTFTDVTQKAGVGDERWGTSASFADVNSDGLLDLYVTNFLNLSLDNPKLCKDKKRGIRIYCGPLQFDGVSDILYMNNGDGTFTDVSNASGISNPVGKGLGVVFVDYDNDGDVDIFIANDSVRNFLYQNDGKGTFTEVTLQSGVGYNEDGKAQAGMGTDAGDYDNDGYLDIFVTNFSDDVNTLYHNNGDKTFEDVSYLTGVGEPSYPYVGWGTNFFDYDNDGDQDLLVVNGHPLYSLEERIEEEPTAQGDLLFENQGNGTFIDVSLKSGDYFHTERVGRGLAVGDYDNDGDIDLFVTNNNQEANLLRNDGGNQNNWLMIKTIGTKSNRDGIGARIKVFSGELTQMDEVRSGTSYLCQNDLRVHCGFGKRRK
ncbi:CRTAC1 family protein, partial [candidate division TA06 bacterium]|nr:CRTAC1 family protein [candidate division TA06 bacterium]